MQSSLEFVLLMLGTAVIGVVVFRYLQLPSILGYLAVGVVIGPHSTGLVSDAQSLEGLAEFGVVFLMFTVGLEFSLSQLLAMRRIVFGLGLAQVSTSIIGSIIITLVIVFILLQLGASWQGALAMGAPGQCLPQRSYPKCWPSGWNWKRIMDGVSSAFCCFRIWLSCFF